MTPKFNELYSNIIESNTSMFTCGYCVEFAISLHKYTGWQLGIFKEIEQDDEDVYYSLIHAFCYAPNGMIADVRGLRTKSKVIDNLLYADTTPVNQDTTKLSEEKTTEIDLENESGYGLEEEALYKAALFIKNNKYLWNI